MNLGGLEFVIKGREKIWFKICVATIRTNFKENDTFPVAKKLLEKNAWEKPEEIRWNRNTNMILYD